MNQHIEREIQEIAEAGGGVLLPAAVVEAARDPTSAMHSHFQWDDTEAAIAYRLSQARELIRSVKVYVTTETFRIAAPAYVRDPDRVQRDQGYASIARIRTNEDAARDVVVAEFSRAAAAVRRARTVALALGLEGQLDEIATRIDAVVSHAAALGTQ